MRSFIAYTLGDLKRLERKQLQVLCKIFGVPSGAKTSHLQDVLSSIAKEDEGVLKIVPFTTTEKERAISAVKAKEPVQIALTKFRADSVGRIYEVQKKSLRKKSSKSFKENGTKEYYPSVTTVLDHTKTYAQRMALFRWREEKIRELGKDGFNALTRQIMQSGQTFHKGYSLQGHKVGKKHNFHLGNISDFAERGLVNGEGFKRFPCRQLECFTRGRVFHKFLSDHLKDFSSQTKERCYPQDLMTEDLHENESLQNLVKSVSGIFERVTDVFAIESSIQHPLLRYAGTLDCVIELDGKTYLVDWKTSKRHRRTLDSCYDYPIQAVAYAGAVNFDPNYNFQTENVALAIAYEDGSPADLHVMSVNDCEEYWFKWLARLSAFYKDFPWESFQNFRACSITEDESNSLIIENGNINSTCGYKTHENIVEDTNTGDDGDAIPLQSQVHQRNATRVTAKIRVFADSNKMESCTNERTKSQASSRLIDEVREDSISLSQTSSMSKSDSQKMNMKKKFNVCTQVDSDDSLVVNHDENKSVSCSEILPKPKFSSTNAPDTKKQTKRRFKLTNFIALSKPPFNFLYGRKK